MASCRPITRNLYEECIDVLVVSGIDVVVAIVVAAVVVVVLSCCGCLVRRWGG